MNQDHAIGGAGVGSATLLLPTVLQHFQGVDQATASAEAGLIVLALGCLWGVVQTLLAVRKAGPGPAPGTAPAAVPATPASPPPPAAAAS